MSRTSVIGASALLLAAAGGAAWWYFVHLQTPVAPDQYAGDDGTRDP